MRLEVPVGVGAAFMPRLRWLKIETTEELGLPNKQDHGGTETNSVGYYHDYPEVVG